MMTPINYRSNQQGAALIVGLIVLLIMTLLGISSMSSTTAELKIANNLQTSNYAFQAAESAIKQVLVTAPVGNWQTKPAKTYTNVYTTSVSSGTVEATAQMLYVGCSSSSVGTDRTSGDQYGGSSTFFDVSHEISVSTTVTGLSNSIIGQSNRLNGRKTVLVGCPP